MILTITLTVLVAMIRIIKFAILPWVSWSNRLGRSAVNR